MNDDTNQSPRGRGRSASSRDFRTVAVPNEQPDLRKLARALLALAKALRAAESDQEARDESA